MERRKDRWEEGRKEGKKGRKRNWNRIVQTDNISILTLNSNFIVK